MANPEIPEREVYGLYGDDQPLTDEDYTDVIEAHIQAFWPPPIPKLEMLCANAERDENGKPVPFHDDQGTDPNVFALADEVVVEIDVHEWCAETGNMDMLENVVE